MPYHGRMNVRTYRRVIVTGGAGFIGSAFVWRLNQEGIDDILVVDELGTSDKWKNLVGLRYTDFVHKDAFLQQVRENAVTFAPDAIIHMGACSATTERDADFLMENNFHYTRTLAEWSIAHGVRFLYASSAATYGDGNDGFQDGDEITPTLTPLNMYGYSKHIFDLHALRTGLVNQMVGLKFFNVFGPNEYHKGSMTSVVYNSFHQILKEGKVKLFRSYREDYGDGDQKRDFVYIKDCVEVMLWLLNHPEVNGIFNIGTGAARPWNALASAVFSAMGREKEIEYVPMPDTLIDRYQYFTEADMRKLRAAGCTLPFRSLEEAVHDYVTGYLAKDLAHLRA